MYKHYFSFEAGVKIENDAENSVHIFSPQLETYILNNISQDDMKYKRV